MVLEGAFAGLITAVDASDRGGRAVFSRGSLTVLRDPTSDTIHMAAERQ